MAACSQTSHTDTPGAQQLFSRTKSKRKIKNDTRQRTCPQFSFRLIFLSPLGADEGGGEGRGRGQAKTGRPAQEETDRRKRPSCLPAGHSRSGFLLPELNLVLTPPPRVSFAPIPPPRVPGGSPCPSPGSQHSPAGLDWPGKTKLPPLAAHTLSHYQPFTPQQGLARESQNGGSLKGVQGPGSGFGVGERQLGAPGCSQMFPDTSHLHPAHLCLHRSLG